MRINDTSINMYVSLYNHLANILPQNSAAI